MADMQQTLSLILKAEDQASTVLREVGEQMARLGNQTAALQEKAARGGLSAGNAEALRTVVANQNAIVQAGVDKRVAALAEEGRKADALRREQAANERSESSARREAELAGLRALRDEAIKNRTALLADDKAARDEQIARARASYATLAELAREEARARRAASDESLRVDLASATRDRVTAIDAERAGGARQIALTPAAAEGLGAASAIAAFDEAVGQAKERAAQLQEQLAALKAPAALAVAAVDLKAVADAARRDVPALDEFSAALKKTVAATGPRVGDQFAVVRASVAGATQALKDASKEQTDAVKTAADQQEQAIAGGLRKQKADVQASVQAQVTAIEAASRHIQALLRAVYSAPGVTEELRAAGMAQAESVRAAMNQMVATAKKGGADLIDTATQTAEMSRAALKSAETAELDDLHRTLQQEIQARRAAGERMTADIKAASAAQERALRSTSAATIGVSKGFNLLTGSTNMFLGPLQHLVAMGEQMAVWGIGYRIVMKTTQALADMAAALVTTNATFETTTKTFEAFYGTAGKQVVDWLDQFAEKTPGTREEVRQAALTVASLGDNIEQTMPDLVNLASVMGKDLPTAAQAFSDAQQGRFEMMQISLRTTKAELQDYGLVTNSVGHIMDNSFVPAFHRYVETRFGEHVRLDAAAVKELHATLGATGGAAQTYAAVARGMAMIGSGELPGEGALSATDPTKATQEQANRQVAIIKAFAQAQTGNIAALHALFGVTAADLDKISENWHKGGVEARKTIDIYFEKHYGGAVAQAVEQTSAMYKQMQTLSGAVSNVQDSFNYLQRIAGQAVFDVLKEQVMRLYDALNSQDIISWAHRLGTALGNLARQGVDAFERWFKQVGGIPGVLRLVTAAWDTFMRVLTPFLAVGQGLADSLGLFFRMLQAVWGAITAVTNSLASLTGSSKNAEGGVRTLAAVLATLFIGLRVGTGLWALFGAAQTALLGVQNSLATAAARVTGTLEGQTVAMTQAAVAARALAAAQAVPGGIGPPIPAGFASIPTVPGGIGAPVPAEMAAQATAAAGAMGRVTAAAGGLWRSFIAGGGALLVFAATAAAVATAAGDAITAIKTARGEDVVGAQPEIAEHLRVPEHWISTIGPPGHPGIQSQGPQALAHWLDTHVGHEAYKDWGKYLGGEGEGILGMFKGGVGGYKGAPGDFITYLQQHPEQGAAFGREYGREHGGGGAEYIRSLMLGTAKGLTPDQAQNPYAQMNAAWYDAAVAAQTKTGQADLPQYRQTLEQARQQLDKARGMDPTKVPADIDTYIDKPFNRLYGKYMKGFAKAVDAGYNAEAFKSDLADASAPLDTMIEQGKSLKQQQEQYRTLRDVAYHGVAAGVEPPDKLFHDLDSSLGKITQGIQQKLQWDEQLGHPFTVIRQDIVALAKNLKQRIAEGMNPEAAAAIMSEAVSGAVNATLTDDLQKPYKQVRKDFEGLSKTLVAEGFDPKVVADALNKATKQYLQQKLQWDTLLGKSIGTIQGDIGATIAHLRSIHTPMTLMATELVPQMLQMAQQDMPQIVATGPQGVKRYFATLKKELDQTVPDAKDRAAILAQITKDYLTTVAQQAQALFQANIALGDTQGALAQIPAQIKQMQRDKVDPKIIAAARKQLGDEAEQPAITAAEKQVDYLEKIRAPWEKIVAAVNSYADLLDKTSLSAQEKFGLVQDKMNQAAQTQVQAAEDQLAYDQMRKASQATISKDLQAYAAALDLTTDTAQQKAVLIRQKTLATAQTQVQSMDLQLQYDQMMHASFATIVADIRNIGQTMTNAGEDFRTIAIKTHQLLVATAQQEEQTQQSYIQYSEMMGENWGIILRHINQRAAAMASTGDTPHWQVVMSKSQDIEQASGGLLTAALALHRPLKALLTIISDGAAALAALGLPKEVVAAWRRTQTQSVYQQQQADQQTHFNLLQEQHRITTPTQVFDFARRQRETERLAGVGADQRQLDFLTTVNSGLGKILDTAQKQLTWDQTEGGNRTLVEKDIRDYLKIYAREPGVTATDVRRERWRLEHAAGAQLPPVAQPYHAYGGLAQRRAAGYGGVTVDFGAPTQQSLLTALLAEQRRQTHYWQQRAARDEQTIGILRAELRTGQDQLGVLRDIRGNLLTAGPTPQRSAHSHLRGAGVPVPIVRP